MPKIRLDQAPWKIANCEPFQCHGALSGVEGTVEDTGRMPKEWADIYREGAEFGCIAYTVLSFGTPIAWRIDRSHWVFPRVGYSATTKARHRPRVREGMAMHALEPITELDQLEPRLRHGNHPSPESGEGAIYSPEYLRRKTPAVS